MRWILAAVVAFPALADEPQVPHFVDETASSGLVSTYAGDWQYMVGGGVSTFDCNGDALPDMVLAGGEGPASLWVNASTATALTFHKATAGIELTAVTGSYPIDIDSDGITDLVVLRIGENVVLRGLGQCQFARANQDWGFDGGDAWSTAFAATWEKGADWPTLAIGNYVDRKAEAFPWGSCTPNWLHRPGAKGFAPPLALTPSYCALSMLFTDWNNSGTPALRVSNDREYYKGGQEQMWHLDPGQPPRLYTEQDGWARLRIWGMGIATDDLDGDGLPEYFLTSMADNKLQGLAQPTGKLLPKYADTAFKRGVIAQRPYIGTDLNPSTAWHAQFADVNNDGLSDIFIAKGNVSSMPDFALHDPNNLLLQRPDGTFAEVGDKAGVASTRTARGAQVVDLNGDGLLDLVVVNRNAGAEVWRNSGPAAGHWLALHLQQSGTNPDAIGARIEVTTDTRHYTRETTLGGGHVSGSLGVQHFGLGSVETAKVTVTWPDGTRAGPFDLTVDAVWRLGKETGPSRN
ncbi:MAG: CRTAC1 family protein [Candidatus Saccharibacteria bacterium]|nr:CRTAC1 family protein [Pseudorhodobacter sp.]